MITPILRRKALVTALAAVLSQAGSASADPRTVVPAVTATPQSIEATVSNPALLMFRAGSYDPATQRLDLSATANPGTLSTRHAIVQFRPEALESGRRALEAQGIEILGYVPNNAYMVRLNGRSLESVKAQAGVRAAEFQSAGLKIDPRLWSSSRDRLLQQVPEDAVSETELLDIIDVRGYAGESSAAIAETLRKSVPGVRISRRSERPDAPPYVHAGVPRAQLDALLAAASAIEGVAFIEPWLPTRLHNAGGIGAIQGNATTACAGTGTVCGPAPLFAQGINGSRQIVAVADSGTTPWAAWFTTLDKGTGPLTEITVSDNPAPVLPATGNLYPNRKIIGYWLQPGGPVDYDYASGHGTHTTGTVVGDAAGTFGANTYLASTPSVPNHELADGMAPNAQLLMQDVGGTNASAVYVTDFTGTLQQAYAGGARVHNNSWGSATAGIYSGNDSEADAVTWADEGLLVVVSAGNDDSGLTQTGTPSNAKNVLSIAALGHAGATNVPTYSNRGPAADGRIKPDIGAPGTSVISAARTTTFSAVPTAPATANFSGTSMAAPTVSGNAALLRQYFTDGFYPRGERTAADAMNPTGALLKAMLINSTNPLGAPAWPNADSGWGRPWLDGNLWFKTTLGGGSDVRRTRFFERIQAAGLKTGDVNEYPIANVAAGQELRVTLAWFDPEAAAGAAIALVNNLDLEVVGPDSTIYKGNVFTAGVSTSGGNADARNTVEQVRLTAPAPGSYTLRVKATAIPGNGRPQSNAQGYALVASGAFGIPDAAAVAAPTGLSVSSNTTSGVAVAFTGTAPQGYQLYRAAGTCATANAAEFHLVGRASASPVVDTSTQGGFSYAYKVRGIGNDVEGAASACLDVVSADDCTLQPTLAAGGLSTDGSNASCSVNLSWPAATAGCPSATMTYTIQRSLDPFFSSPATIASGIAATSFVDTNTVNGQAYFYRYLASDSFGNMSPPSNVANATTSGAAGPDPLAFFDNAEGVAWLTAELPWGFSTLAAADGTHSYHTGGQAANHPDLACASIETPALTIPTGGRLSFSARYNLEFQWDGVVTEISTNGGTTWTDLPPAGGYPTVFNTSTAGVINACGFPNGKGIYSGVTTAASNADPGNDAGVPVFKPFTIDLSSYAGQSVKVRWRLSSDPGLNYSGFFLDQVRVGNTDLLFRNGFDIDQYMCQ
ncbi:MAG: S8 family serine peptidase [Xanthomonadales bacterium]|nr:S8 family serine peptidase [Xanthomonadales bacterium]